MMNNIKFPARHTDGSFCVDVVIAVNTNDAEGFRQKVNDWLQDWGKRNPIWVRNWSNGETEKMVYEQEFKQFPIPISCTSTNLTIRLQGQQSSGKAWKDWLVIRILPELKATFSEIQEFESVRNCS